jgi:hypothetical protein
MRAIACFVGLACATLLACQASQPRPLKISKEPFQNTGLHLVELPGKGELLVAPDLERVRRQLRETDGAIVRCQVTVKEREDSTQLADAKQALEQELCGVVEKSIVARPRPKTGPGSEAPARIASEPGPGIMFVEAWLLDVEGGTAELRPTPRSMFSLRLSESLGGKPVMRYYEPVGTAAGGPLDALVDSSLDRLYAVYERVLETPTDVAAPPQ